MPKIQIAAWKMPFEDGNVIDAEIPEPGEIIGNFIHHDPQEVTLLDRDGVKRDPAALVVILRTDPDRPRRLRRFVRIPVGCIMESGDAADLKHLCTFTNPISGDVTALFEAPMPDMTLEVRDPDTGELLKTFGLKKREEPQEPPGQCGECGGGP